MVNEVTIQWEKKEIGFRFSMLTLEIYTDAMGIEFAEFPESFKRNPIKADRVMLFAAHEVYTEGKPTLDSNPYKFDKFYSSLSKSDKDKIKVCLTNSLSLFKDVKGTSDDEKKN